jgi:hypothetical protein
MAKTRLRPAWCDALWRSTPNPFDMTDNTRAITNYGEFGAYSRRLRRASRSGLSREYIGEFRAATVTNIELRVGQRVYMQGP